MPMGSQAGKAVAEIVVCSVLFLDKQSRLQASALPEFPISDSQHLEDS